MMSCDANDIVKLFAGLRAAVIDESSGACHTQDRLEPKC
jgi:hypothetical protein